MRIILISLLIIFGINAFSQDTIIKYFDKDGLFIEDKENAQFYNKIVKVADSIWYLEIYNINDEIDFTGSYKTDKFKIKNGYFKFYYKNGELEKEGNYIDKTQNGIWKYYSADGILNYTVEYKDNIRGDSCYYYQNGEKINNLYFSNDIDITSEFPGGQKELLNFIAKNLKYPDIAKEKGYQGIVFLSFIVEENGSVSNIRVLQSINPILDNECIKVIKKFPIFKPGEKDGIPVKTSLIVPMMFRLN
jgi:TonB family protein